MFRAKHKLVFIVYKGNSPPRESITFAQNSLSLSEGVSGTKFEDNLQRKNQFSSCFLMFLVVRELAYFVPYVGPKFNLQSIRV